MIVILFLKLIDNRNVRGLVKENSGATNKQEEGVGKND
ncbi:hypothetical protein NT05LI_1895 [Listeria ivanovii FSL F6-596]|nr:hypothetical protein NT05LI_1895 [Listeria ivanovii FSL F6-596]